MSKPTITEREVSLRQAQAGIKAREAAQALGGDPTQVGALLHAAGTQAPGFNERPNEIGGVTFHGLDLATSLANTALTKHAGFSPDAPTALQVARMALIFAEPLDAFDQLTYADPVSLREFDQSALELTAHWLPADLDAFGAYLQSLRPAREEVETPGKPQTSPARKRPRRNV